MDHTMDYGGYMPHGMCLLWEPWLVLLWAGSDLLIFLSYTAIPIALLRVLRKRTEVPHGGLVALFASFILLCGLTHLLGIVTLWFPIYPWTGWVKLATGIVSMTTAVVLFRLIPDIIRLPSPASLAAVNQTLSEEIAAHKATLASLDRQVQERTRELERATAALAVQAREAVHRSGNLLAVVHSLATQSARGTERTSEFLEAFLGRVRALADTTRAIARSDRSSAELGQLVNSGLEVLRSTYGPRISVSGPALAVDPVAAQQLSLALYELATNTQKYGLGASDQVDVAVRWSVDDGRFTFVWNERGLPGAAGEAAPNPEGFGTKLLMQIVPRMLGGEAERKLAGSEMVYCLSAPVDGVIAKETDGSGDPLAARIIDTSFGLD
ncbi:sensor histidine kinase [Blastomonas sp. UPD001]|jgi:two-component sensor histidine kinase|uniref:sensor histidine kinase n=1 Tax=Blastomonas sp. UPD001 TaxID=2217673 RepID=UPI000E349513|nr:sensor histidine kinase [Blastomonas sp. UPD001]